MIPAFVSEGLLPSGLHAASLREVEARYGGSARRDEQLRLLREVVGAALFYPSIKRVLLWGSFVSSKEEPNDLDYSLVVGINHPQVQVAKEHKRFLVPFEARTFYGADTSYFIVQDWKLETYIQLIDFFSLSRQNTRCGVVEISLRGESYA